MAFNKKEAISYVEDIPVKIGEKFRPPKQVLLPIDFELLCIPTGLLDEEYDFELEKKVLLDYECRKQAEKKLQEESTARSSSSSASDNGSCSADSEHADPSNSSHPGDRLLATIQPGTILQPQPLSEDVHGAEEDDGSKERQRSFNPADFESDVSSPFDYIELQTLNDLEELSTVFQGMSRTSGDARPQQDTAQDDQQSSEYPHLAKLAAEVPPLNGVNDVVLVNKQNNFADAMDAMFADAPKAPGPVNGISWDTSAPAASEYNYTPSYAAPPSSAACDGHSDDTQPGFPCLRNAKSASDLQNVPDVASGSQQPLRSKTPPPCISADRQLHSRGTLDASVPAGESRSDVGLLRKGSLPASVAPSINKRLSSSETQVKTVVPSLPDPYFDLTDNDRSFVDSLTDMGFPRPRVSRAVKYLGPDEKKVVDYLCQVQALEESGYDSNDAETALVLNDHRIEEAKTFLNMMNQFSDLGFEREAVKRALVKYKNDRDKALDVLLSSSL